MFKKIPHYFNDRRTNWLSLKVIMNIKTYLNEQKWYVSNIIVLSIIVVSLSNPGLLNARVFESQATKSN